MDLHKMAARIPTQYLSRKYYRVRYYIPIQQRV